MSDARYESLELSLGCTFGLESTQAASAVMQVAPRPQPGLSIAGERWHASEYHHTYVDHYGNTCERFELAAGATRISYEAEVVVAEAADVIEPDARETPVSSLPDEVLSFVMPSRFCLPDELGHEA